MFKALTSALKGAGGRLSSGAGKLNAAAAEGTGYGAAAHVVTGADLLLYPGMGILGGIGKSVQGALGTGNVGRLQSPELRAQMMMASNESGQRMLAAGRARQKKYEALQKRMGQSLARLAASSPQTYQQVMTGRQLPQGAVVLGGQPRVDLMEDLALRMATSPNSIPGGPAQPSVMDLI